MKLHAVRWPVMCTSMWAIAFSCSAAQAQEEAGPAEEAGSGEIVVTAQKRAERLQDVPISMAVFDEEALTKANVMTVQDLSKIATNFTVAKGAQSSYLRLNVRGIGAAGNTAIEPSVAVFVDGVYVPRAGAIIGNFLDMEGVEVLRGPQGTLFGRNASVGALSLRTADPEFDFSGRVTGEYGTGDRYKVDGYINVPLGDSIAFRLAGMSQWFGGYWTNTLDGKQYGGTDDQALRASLKAEFGDLTWIVRGDYNRSEGDGVANFDFAPRSVTPAQLNTLRTRLGGVLPDTNLSDRTMNQFITADLNDEQWGISSNASLDLDGSTIRLINSYRDWQNEQIDGDVTFMPLPLVSRTGAYSSKSQNHELQFISPTDEWMDGRLDLVAGLYYFSEDYRIGEQFHLDSQFCNVLAPAPARGLCNGTLAAGLGVNATDQTFSQDVDSFAAYGQATFKLADPLSLTLGGRWTKDEKSGSFDQFRANPFAAALRAPEHLTLPDVSEDRFTYRVSLNYKPSEDHLLFANYSTGYKSGGYNSGGGTPSQTVVDASGNAILDANGDVQTKRVFGRETVENYEIGAKTSWLDDALRANVTIFRMDIKGFQDRSFDGTSFVVRNAGNLRQQGVEFDMAIRPSSNFSFNGAVAYLDSEFTRYPGAAGLPGFPATVGGVPNPAAVQDLTGKPATFSPRWSGNVGAEWTGDLGDSGMTWAVNSNLSFTGDYYDGLVNDANPQSKADGYALLGARVTINGENERWSVSAFGNNLTDTAYCSGTAYQPIGAAFGLNNGVPTGQTGLIAPGVQGTGSTAVRCLRADPRTYGVSATIRF